MRNLPLHPYIANVLAHSNYWNEPDVTASQFNQHILPTLNDPGWAQSFNEGSELVKRNIAHAWVWAYAVKATYKAYDSYGQNGTWCIERSMDWLRKIDGYVTPETSPKQINGDFQFHSQMLFYRHLARPYAAEQRALTFGTSASQLAQLLALSNDPTVLGGMCGYALLHNRIWEIASLPVATHDHRVAAGYVAAFCGTRRVETTPALHDGFLDWYRLGDCAAYSEIKFPNQLARFRKVKQFIQSTDPQLTIPVFTRLLHRLIEHNEHCNGLTYDETTGRGYDVTLDNVFQLMHTWYPQFTAQWTLMESLGISLTEVAPFMHTQLSTGTSGEIELPTDLVLE